MARWLFAVVVLGLLGWGVLAQNGGDLADPGPFRAGWQTVTVTRPNGTNFTARPHYPATASGQNAPFDPSGGPYPAVTFGHGFVQPVTQYQSTMAHLATRGYLVIASESEGGLFPSHANFAADLRHCLTWLEQRNADSGSFLFGRVRTDRFGASGHSMGGGASILATAADPRIKALANLAAAETNPSAIAAMPNVAVPFSLISGSQDSIVPPGTNGQRMYDAGGTPKTLPNITGGFHCGFVDASSFGCDSGGVTRTVQLAETRRQLTAFFDLYLRDDEANWSFVWGPAMRSNPQTVTQVNPGVTLTPIEQTWAVLRGGRSRFTMTVTNRGRGPTSYTVLVSGNRWPIQVETPQTAVLPFNGTANVSVAFTGYLPTGMPETDTVTVSVRSDSDGKTRAYATLNLRTAKPAIGRNDPLRPGGR